MAQLQIGSKTMFLFRATVQIGEGRPGTHKSRMSANTAMMGLDFSPIWPTLLKRRP
jgi:hypothetical protein